jgi:hypothetical protein
MSQNEPPDGAPGGLEPPADPPTDSPAAAPQPMWPDAAAAMPAGATTPGPPEGTAQPPEGWAASTAPRPARRFGLLPRLIIPGIIVVVLLVGFLLRDRISGNAADLKPGDCFDDPVSAGSSGAEIEDVQHQPCSEAHLFEVVDTFKFPSSGDAAFPGQAGFESFIVEKCSAAFVNYVGIPEEQSSLSYTAYTPVEAGWKKGDRDITCFLGAVDGSKLTGSMKNARR